MDNLKPIVEIEDVNFEDSDKIDKANRKDAILHFEKILKNIIPPYIIAINGSWGTGKTFFLKMLKNKIQNEHRVLYHSAWEHDYSSDPLLSLMASLKNEFQDVNKFIDLMESAGRVVLASIPHVTSILTQGFVRPELSEGLINSVASAVGKEASRNKDAVVDFKNKLTTLVNSEIAGKKLIIIIDDLDRCKPTYAIEVLEKIKHLFNVERVVFIVGIDKSELEHCINAVYGSGYDSKHYLQRFFDLEYDLPHVISVEYINHVLSELGLLEFFKPRVTKTTNSQVNSHPIDQIRTVLLTFHKLYRFDLRQIQRLLHRFALLAHMANSEEEIEPIYMLTLLILYQNDIKLYNYILTSGGNMDKNLIDSYNTKSEMTNNKSEQHLFGIIAGMTTARKAVNQRQIIDFFNSVGTTFSEATMQAYNNSIDYIDRTDNFLKASKNFKI